MMLLPRRNSLRAILDRVLDTLAVVDKRREIYFVKNVKIHVDRVRHLGKFLEVEAISRTGDVKRNKIPGTPLPAPVRHHSKGHRRRIVF